MSSIEKVLTAAIGVLGVIAVGYVLVSKTSRTAGVVTSFGKATSGSIAAAEGRGGT